MKSIASFLNAEDYLPHGYCLLWRPEIVWLHILSDAAIASAYFGIPMVLFYFVRKRGDLPHEPVLWLLGAFILLCGTTHLAAIWVLWQPYFGIEGLIKAATAIVSILTLIVGVKLLPQALLIPSSAQLAQLNDDLQRNIREREAAQQQLLTAYAQMEETVEERTAELRTTLTQLAKSNADLEQLAYITSHDLKEPLRGLGYHAAVLLEDYGDRLDEAGVKRLRRLMQIPQKLDALISDLHKYARLGHEQLTMEKTDLNAVVGEVEDLLDVFLREEKAQIVVETEFPQIRIDRTWIGRIFQNLIGNAIKYNNSGRPVVRIGCLREEADPDGGSQNVFYVRDNGIGIDPKFHEQIFDLFKRLNPEKQNKKGTGMGLAFVRRIVERHGGRIWLESAVGQGTTFYFTLEPAPIRAVA
jgi:signal transduction histidine kinase